MSYLFEPTVVCISLYFLPRALLISLKFVTNNLHYDVPANSELLTDGNSSSWMGMVQK